MSAGYSGTPLPKKLGIKEEARLVIVGDVPGDFDRTLGRLPAGVEVRRRTQGRADVIVCFVTRKAQLTRRFPALKRTLEPHGGGLWIAWPKRASGVPTDMTEDVVREIALPGGLVDNKVCAIDETWSGLRLVYRVSDRRVADRPRRKGA
jgi:hypothetical protein